MENIPVNMVLGDLRVVTARPPISFPAGFGVRPLADFMNAGLWTDVQREAEEHFAIRDDLFRREFGDDERAITARCFFVVGPRQQAVGTISGWMGGRGDATENWGRIHWVAVRPAYQGRGLGRAALDFVLRRLVKLGHERAWLATSTGRLPALKLYLDAGFVPDLDPPGAREAWQVVRAALPHPLLATTLDG